MKTDNKEMNVYVQPDCKVYHVQLQQVIATSPTNTNSNEEYETGDTSSWF